MDNLATSGGVPRETEPIEVSSARMTHASEFLTELLANLEEFSCSVCRKPSMRRRGSADEVCRDCEVEAEQQARCAAEAASVLGSLDRTLPAWCARVGMSQREATARWAQVPAGLARVLGGLESATKLLAGGLPDRGFGLSGVAGVGKTFALSALFKRSMVARARACAATEGRKAVRPWLEWCRWPEVVNWMRVTSTQEGGMAAVESRLEAIAEAEAVVLDDLGAERLRGEYAEDWSASQLDALVDRRYNAMRPTWWTTNLSPDEFRGRYGTRLFSRLTGSNAFLEVDTIPDLRGRGGR